jgi:hypothetical protein
MAVVVVYLVAEAEVEEMVQTTMLEVMVVQVVEEK